MWRRTSTATWSLRLRPVWIFLPRSPSVSVRRVSTAMWTSWSCSRTTKKRSATTSASAARTRAASSCVTTGGVTGISESIVTWAAVPRQSQRTRSMSRTGSSPTV